jgi:hypothetical protein
MGFSLQQWGENHVPRHGHMVRAFLGVEQYRLRGRRCQHRLLRLRRQRALLAPFLLRLRRQRALLAPFLLRLRRQRALLAPFLLRLRRQRALLAPFLSGLLCVIIALVCERSRTVREGWWESPLLSGATDTRTRLGNCLCLERRPVATARNSQRVSPRSLPAMYRSMSIFYATIPPREGGALSPGTPPAGAGQ